MTRQSAAPGVAWICGASHGIGRELARELVRAGWQVAASARSRDALQTLVEETGGAARAYPLDVTLPETVTDSVRAIEREMGPIDLAVLNAGVYDPMPLETFSAEACRQTFEVNLMGVVNGLDALLPGMRSRARGQVLVMGSVAGYRGLPMGGAYGASKAALINLSESLAPELARDGVRLRVVNPGFVRTRLTDKNPFPMPARITPQMAAQRIVAGLDRRGFEITFPRRFTYFLKLLRCLPYRLYFVLMRRVIRP